MAFTTVLDGPFGGPGGGFFDDGGDLDAEHQNIKSIQVFSGETIDRIIVVYTDGTSSFRRQHGGSNGGGANPVFSINVEQGERLVEVSGHFGIFDTTVEITGLQFGKRDREGRLIRSDEAGPKQGQFFNHPARPNEEIFSFFGREGLFLDALGFHVRQAQ